MNEFRTLDLFSGIGGMSLGLERAGMRVVFQCEADAYCRRVLARHWPGVPCYHDIAHVDQHAPRVDVLAGGFPCQPVSKAGRRRAQADERWLWPEFERIIGEFRPSWVIAENVPGLRRRGLALVLGGLADLGYDAEWIRLSAAAVGAPHLRERIFIVAYPQESERGGAQLEDMAQTTQRTTELGERGGSLSRERYVADANGGGARMVERGKTELGGALPVDPSGGVLGANPTGATGMIRFAEAALQVRGQAGEHQVDGARVALGHAQGGAASYLATWLVGSEKP